MRQLVLGAAFLLASGVSLAQTCPSRATIQVQSSNYSGAFTIELRAGTRPGSTVAGQRNLSGPGTASFSGVCAGTYFFTLGTPDSNSVSTTQYFTVVNDDRGYSHPTITVFYARSQNGDSKTLGSAKRKDL